MGNNVVRAFTGEEDVDSESTSQNEHPWQEEEYEAVAHTSGSTKPRVEIRPGQEVVLVLGGTGVIGKGIVTALLERGHIPVVPARYPARLRNLQEYLESYMAKKGDKQKPCYLIEEDISTEQGAMRVRDLVLQRYGRIDRVISALACRWPGCGTTQNGVDEFRKMLECTVMVQYIAARTFLPVLARNKHGSYTIVTGRTGEACPTAELGFTTVACSSLFGLVLALKTEAKSYPGVVINEARVGIRVVPECDLSEEQTVFGEHQAMNPLDMGAAIAAIALSEKTKSDYPPFFLYSPEEIRDTRRRLEPEEITAKKGTSGSQRRKRRNKAAQQKAAAVDDEKQLERLPPRAELPT